MTPAVAVAKAFGQLHASVGFPDYELLLSRGYRRFLEPGQVVFDVGCHAGLHLEQFLGLIGPSGHVVAFEPIPALADALIRKYDDWSNVHIRCLAVADKSCRSEFLVLHNALGMSGFKQRVEGGEQKAEKVNLEVDTLDRQARDLSRLDLYKDRYRRCGDQLPTGCEGHCSSLSTVHQRRVRHADVLLFGNTAMTLFVWARENGYVLSDFFGNLITSPEDWALVCDYSLCDFFLVPDERQQQWASLF